jgi:hypothetical protein
MSPIVEELRSLWPVPRLTILAPSDLIVVLQHHYRSCGKDHQALRDGAPNVSAIDFGAEAFVCNHCDGSEQFKLSHADAASTEQYICALLEQGADFNTRHFASCVVAAEGPKQ